MEIFVDADLINSHEAVKCRESRDETLDDSNKDHAGTLVSQTKIQGYLLQLKQKCLDAKSSSNKDPKVPTVSETKILGRLWYFKQSPWMPNVKHKMADDDKLGGVEKA